VADYSLVPVDYQPDFSDYSLVPVDYDPFGADGVTRQAAAPGESYDPESPSGTPASGQSYSPSAAPISPPGKPVPANQQQPGDMSGPTSGVSGPIGAKIAELASDFYNQSILKPARDLRDMGHDLVTDPAYFLHAIGPSLVGLGMSAPAPQVGTVGLAERAKGIHSVLDEIAQQQRTTAVLETDVGRIIASGGQDLNPLQKAILGRGEIAAKAPRVHAEITALDKAAIIGATPSKLAVTRAICPQCAAVIESRGGRSTSPTTAVFPRR
jgi:Cytidine and deoxycytidylate deaminase zinc-binding region